MKRTIFLSLLLVGGACERRATSTTCSADGTCHLGEDTDPPVITLGPPLAADAVTVNGASPGMTCAAEVCTLVARVKVTDGRNAWLTGAKLDGVDVPFDKAASTVTLSFPSSENGTPEHLLMLEAVNAAGNVGKLTRLFRVDVVGLALTFATFDADYDCSSEVCTGAVVNLASLSADGKSVVLAGRTSDPGGRFSLRVGDALVDAPPQPDGAWSYSWEVGATSGEVTIVAHAEDLAGNAVEIARRVWVDVAAPTCALGQADGARRVSRDTVLLTCSEPMALGTVQEALTLSPPPGLGEIYRAEGNSFFVSQTLPSLFGNTAYALALGAGATDRAGNPAAPLPMIVFRTVPVLPSTEQALKGNLQYPRMAIDLDDLPWIFAWEWSTTRQVGRQVLFTWDGQGDGTNGRGAWISRIPAIAEGKALGPVRDFRWGAGARQLDKNLGIIHTGRVLMSPVSALGGATPVNATYAQSTDDLVTFHGASGAVAPDVLDGIVPGTTPAFYGDQTAAVDADGDWAVTAAMESVLLSSFSDSNVKALDGSLGWAPNPRLFTPIGATGLVQHQAAFVGNVYPPEMFPRRHVWHVPLGDVPAAIDPAIDIGVVAGLKPLVHALPDGTTYATAYVAWAEAQRRGNIPHVLRLGCEEPYTATPTWHYAVIGDATEIVGLDFGQGISKVAIAVDMAESNAARYSRFGLLAGNTCATSNVIDWDTAGSTVPGRHPTTAFSNAGVFWRVVETDDGLRVLPPLKL